MMGFWVILGVVLISVSWSVWVNGVVGCGVSFLYRLGMVCVMIC